MNENLEEEEVKLVINSATKVLFCEPSCQKDLDDSCLRGLRRGQEMGHRGPSFFIPIPIPNPLF